MLLFHSNKITYVQKKPESNAKKSHLLPSLCVEQHANLFKLSIHMQVFLLLPSSSCLNLSQIYLVSPATTRSNRFLILSILLPHLCYMFYPRLQLDHIAHCNLFHLLCLTTKILMWCVNSNNYVNKKLCYVEPYSSNDRQHPKVESLTMGIIY